MSAPWDFDYAPVTPAAVPVREAHAVVVATRGPAPIGALLGAEASPLIERAPLFWTEVRFAQARSIAGVAARLREAGVALRYVASAEQASLALGEPLELRGAPRARPDAWPIGDAAEVASPAPHPGRWFLGAAEGGVAVDRAVCGAGRGTRLAVIDDDAAEVARLGLSAEILVGVEAVPRHGVHGSLMVAWATSQGVAPGASRRLYLVPKPGRGVVALALAIARAALDGADVILCATYVEGSQSPMLDDALAVAAALGRRGRGAAVVMPTGREAASPPGSLHASFSLGFGEPASDPRVFCVAPGARGEGWFLWRDRAGKLRPFANRGPAVRWLAPGDDLAYPLAAEDAPPRLFHAESSGASAIAAGVLLLVLAANPRLRRAELARVVDGALEPVPAPPPVPGPLADPADLRPLGRDRDGHDAKHGEGRIHAARACLAAADPLCAALVAVGEDEAARAYALARPRAYSRRLGRWAARALLADPEGARAARVIVRHLRLLAAAPERAVSHGSGALLRHLSLLVRCLLEARPAPLARAELLRASERLAALAGDPRPAEEALAALARRCLRGVRSDAARPAKGAVRRALRE